MKSAKVQNEVSRTWLLGYEGQWVKDTKSLSNHLYQYVKAIKAHVYYIWLSLRPAAACDRSATVRMRVGFLVAGKTVGVWVLAEVFLKWFVDQNFHLDHLSVELLQSNVIWML